MNELEYRLKKAIERTIEDYEHETGENIEFDNIEYREYYPELLINKWEE